MSRAMAARVRELSAGRVPFVHATVVRAQVPTSAKAGDDAIVLRRRHDRGLRRRAVRRGLGADGGARRAAGRRDRAAAGAARRQRAVPGLAGRAGGGQPCLSGGALEIFLRADAAGAADRGRRQHPGRPTRWSGSPRCSTTRTARSLPGAEPGDASAVVIASHGRDEHEAIRRRWRPASRTSRCVASRRRGAAVLDELDLTPDRAGPDLTPRPGSTSAPAPRARWRCRSWPRWSRRCARPSDRPSGRPRRPVERPVEPSDRAVDPVVRDGRCAGGRWPAAAATDDRPGCGMTVVGHAGRLRSLAVEGDRPLVLRARLPGRTAPAGVLGS